MTPEERLNRIEALLVQQAQQNAEQERNDSQRRVQQEQAQAEQNALWQERLNETRSLQDRNAEAISQQLEMISQLRQIVVNTAMNASDLKSELARHANNPNAHGGTTS